MWDIEFTPVSIEKDQQRTNRRLLFILRPAQCSMKETIKNDKRKSNQRVADLQSNALFADATHKKR